MELYGDPGITKEFLKKSCRNFIEDEFYTKWQDHIFQHKDDQKISENSRKILTGSVVGVLRERRAGSCTRTV